MEKTDKIFVGLKEIISESNESNIRVMAYNLAFDIAKQEIDRTDKEYKTVGFVKIPLTLYYEIVYHTHDNHFIRAVKALKDYITDSLGRKDGALRLAKEICDEIRKIEFEKE